MTDIFPFFFLIVPQAVGIYFLSRYFREERVAGNQPVFFRPRQGEGRWGSVLIFMGAVLIFVIGTEKQVFPFSGWQKVATGLSFIILVGGLSEGIAWQLGKWKG